MNRDDQPGTSRVGAAAEAAGCRFLEARGLRLVERNFRCRSGEIDLVMRDGPDLVMVEVRYRARTDPVHPAQTITPAKRRRLLRAAAFYLQRLRWDGDRGVRFDVLSISGPLTSPSCEWIRSAFTADDA